MPMPTAAQIIAILPKAPDEGMTSLEIATHFNAASYLGSKLSKLADYGRIEKVARAKGEKTRWRRLPEARANRTAPNEGPTPP